MRKDSKEKREREVATAKKDIMQSTVLYRTIEVDRATETNQMIDGLLNFL